MPEQPSAPLPKLKRSTIEGGLNLSLQKYMKAAYLSGLPFFKDDPATLPWRRFGSWNIMKALYGNETTNYWWSYYHVNVVIREPTSCSRHPFPLLFSIPAHFLFNVNENPFWVYEIISSAYCWIWNWNPLGRAQEVKIRSSASTKGFLSFWCSDWE